MSDLRLEAAEHYEEAHARRRVGNVTGALFRYHRALTILEQLGDNAWRAQIAFEMAEMHHEAAETGDARRWYREALRLYRETGNDEPGGIILFRLAQVEQLRGDMTAAEQLFREALEHPRVREEPEQQARTRAGLGRLLWEMGQEAEGAAEVISAYAELRRLQASDADAVRQHIRGWSERIGRLRYRRLIQAATPDPELRAQLME